MHGQEDGNVTINSNESCDEEEVEYLTLSDAQVANHILGQVVSCSAGITSNLPFNPSIHYGIHTSTKT